MAELEALDGEVLPDRTVLSSLISISGVNVNILTSTNTSSSVMPAGNGDIAYACQATSSPGSAGVLGLLGLGSSSPSSGMTCVPAAIITH
jgi:hypothetical protein